MMAYNISHSQGSSRKFELSRVKYCTIVNNFDPWSDEKIVLLPKCTCICLILFLPVFHKLSVNFIKMTRQFYKYMLKILFRCYV